MLDQVDTEVVGICVEPVFAAIDVRSEELHELLIDMRSKGEEELDQLAQ
jgi:hypothetical protein